MRKALRPAALGLAGLFIAVSGAAFSPAFADVKAGVDAWSRGEYRKAVEEWRPAAIAGDADAQFNLGVMYAQGRGVVRDDVQAIVWYRKAAGRGDARAVLDRMRAQRQGRRIDRCPKNWTTDVQ